MKKTSIKQFQADLAALAAGLRRQIEAECDAFPVDAAASRARRLRVQGDFPYFRRAYFPHYTRGQNGAESTAAASRTPALQGTGTAAAGRHGDSRLHLYFDKALPAAVDAPEGVKLATAAPRGEAKTTFVSLFFVLWCVLTGRKRYILLMADALTQAASFLEALKAELENNPRLRTDFPEHCGQGRVWNVGTIVTAANVKVQAFGAGKRMRGLRHGPHRPDLAILDDLENDENVRKPEQRDKLEGWLTRTVLSLGPADDSMDVIYVGTILHYDSVLARTLKKSTWTCRTFRAVIRWPDRMDLWERWEALLAADGPAQARAYYAAQQAAMDAGAEVNWPAFRPLYTLMLKRAEDHAAFDAEMQNAPLATDGAPFAECVRFWTEPAENLLIFGACDPSLGRAGTGRDPSALLVGGYDRAHMTLRVLEASIIKRHPDRIIEDMIALQRQYSCLLWAVETVQFQAFFADVLVRRAAEQGVSMPVRPVLNRSDKRLRIESLQPYAAQGRILLHPSQTTLCDQLRHFPAADHDDGPDALEMLWRVAAGGFVSLQDAFERVPRTTQWHMADRDAEDSGHTDETRGAWR